jgi:hypothetical protein
VAEGADGPVQVGVAGDDDDCGAGGQLSNSWQQVVRNAIGESAVQQRRNPNLISNRPEPVDCIDR